MTDVSPSVQENQLKQLELDNAALKKQLENNGKGVEGLLCQLDAHKQMINEALTQSVGFRTQIILLQKQNKELSDKLALANKAVE